MLKLNVGVHQLYISSKNDPLCEPGGGMIALSFVDNYEGSVGIRADLSTLDEDKEDPNTTTWIVDSKSIYREGHIKDLSPENFQMFAAALMTHALIDPRLGELKPGHTRVCKFIEKDHLYGVSVVLSVRVYVCNTPEIFTFEWDSDHLENHELHETRDDITRYMTTCYKNHCQPKSSIHTITTLTEPPFK